MSNIIKCFQIYILNMSVLFTPCLSLAQQQNDVGLIRSIEVSREEFSEYLVHHSNYLSYAKVTLQNLVSKVRVKDLKERFFRAQRSYLDDSLHVASEQYKAIINLAHQEQWAPSERLLISQSFFRMALIEKPKAHFWLTQAVHFDESLEPDLDYFSPKLRQEWLSISKKISKTLWLGSTKSNMFDLIIVNGKVFPFDSMKDISLSAQMNIVTLVSNAYKPQTKIGSPEEINSWSPNLVPLVMGACDAFESNIEPLRKFEILFVDSCLANLHSNEVIPAANKIKLGDLKITDSTNIESKSSSSEIGVSNGSSLIATTRSKKKSWFAKNWVWVALTTGAAIYAANEKSSVETKVVPSHRSR